MEKEGEKDETKGGGRIEKWEQRVPLVGLYSTTRTLPGIVRFSTGTERYELLYDVIYGVVARK